MKRNTEAHLCASVSVQDPLLETRKVDKASRDYSQQSYILVSRWTDPHGPLFGSAASNTVVVRACGRGLDPLGWRRRKSLSGPRSDKAGSREAKTEATCASPKGKATESRCGGARGG